MSAPRLTKSLLMRETKDHGGGVGWEMPRGLQSLEQSKWQPAGVVGWQSSMAGRGASGSHKPLRPQRAPRRSRTPTLAPSGSDSISPGLKQPWKIARLVQPVKYFTKGWIVAQARGAPW